MAFLSEAAVEDALFQQLRDTLLPKLISGELRVPAVMVEGMT